MIHIPECCALPTAFSAGDVHVCITCGSKYVLAGGNWVLCMIPWVVGGGAELGASAGLMPYELLLDEQERTGY